LSQRIQERHKALDGESNQFVIPESRYFRLAQAKERASGGLSKAPVIEDLVQGVSQPQLRLALGWGVPQFHRLHNGGSHN
jgi:hypothetical protein